MSKEILLDRNTFNPNRSGDWLWLIKKTIALDEHHGTPNGWHWFWGIYYLEDAFLNFDFKKVADALPHEHWRIKQQKEDDKWEEDMKRARENPDSIGLRPDALSARGSYEKMKEWVQAVNLSKKITKITFFNTPFDKSIDFSNFIFPVNTDFRLTTFSKNVIFENAVFLKAADFKDVKFHGDTAKFRNTVFKKTADFRNAEFKVYGNFKNSVFGGRTAFQKATFETHAPRFYDATFNNEMTWTGIELPKFKKINEGKNNKETNTDYKNRISENQNSYENTSILLGEKNKYHDQHFFFREEMRCRRELEDDPFIGLAYKLYENFADYGYGIDRAFKAWVRHIVYGFIAILIMAGISIIIQSWYGHWQGVINLADTFFCSAVVSATNATPYVFIGADDGFLMNCYKGLQSLNPLIFNVIRIVQTVVGVAFLFLLLTTLRVRFRLKITNN